MSVSIVPKFFNTAGPGIPGDHYMIDPLRRIDYENISALIDRKRYFVLHAPRQTGKTTSLLAMVERINAEGRYRCAYMNVESAQTARSDVQEGMKAILSSLESAVERYFGCELGDGCPLSGSPAEIVARNGGNSAFAAELKALCRALDAAKRPLVLFIDEIDALVGDTLVSVLRQLRTGYTNRPESFPISVILCGVRDVRDYRISTSGGDVITGGSCFNIKAESLRLGDFSDDEIRELYLQHTEATGQVFEEDVYPRVWELTRGQPWLVNALAHEATWRMKDARDRAVPITLARIDQAAENLILERATHLDQLIDKLSEPRVRRVIEPLLSGDDALLSLPDDDVRYAIDLGLIRRKDGIGSIEIANAIYKEVIPRQLTWTTQATITQDTAWYVAPDGRLDMTKLICAFQQFFRENAESWIERFDYKEAGFQLLLQAFLQRIVNGGGLIEREYALGRRRVDLLVRWPYPKDAGMRDRLEQRVVLELKTIRKKHSPEYVLHEGLEQTAAYADAAGADEAHLLICDERPGISRSWDEKIYDRVERAQGGKQIHVWGM